MSNAPLLSISSLHLIPCTLSLRSPHHNMIQLVFPTFIKRCFVYKWNNSFSSVTNPFLLHMQSFLFQLGYCSYLSLIDYNRYWSTIMGNGILMCFRCCSIDLFDYSVKQNKCAMQNCFFCASSFGMSICSSCVRWLRLHFLLHLYIMTSKVRKKIMDLVFNILFRIVEFIWKHFFRMIIQKKISPIKNIVNLFIQK
jgi:hypothetical protein